MRIDLSQKIEFIDSNEFHRPEAEAEILAPSPPRPEHKHDSSSQIAMMSLPSLTRWETRHYFRKMNFLKFQAEQIRTSQKPDVDAIVSKMGQATEIQNLLVQSNVPLIAFFNRYRTLTDDRISDGIVKLYDCVRLFNYLAGFSFGTYAELALSPHKQYTPKSERFNNQMVRGSSVVSDGKPRDLLADVHDYREPTIEDFVELDEAKQITAEVMPILTPRKHELVSMRFGLNGHEPHTLDGIVEAVGTSTENIRMLIKSALRQAYTTLHRQAAKRLSQLIRTCSRV